MTWARKVWRYQRGNHNPYIKEEQKTQWPKEKGQKDKQRYKPDRIFEDDLKVVFFGVVNFAKS
jgi:hypothetical protein